MVDRNGLQDKGSSFSDDLTDMPVERILADVRACVSQNISVAGLALALTIPDVLGAKCYPELTHDDGSRKIRSQYSRWFDHWVAKRFVDKQHWFSGEMCYELRCSLLHAGNADIDYHHSEQRGVRYAYTFSLVDDGEQSHEEKTLADGTRACHTCLNADNLASAICDGAQECLASL